MTDGTNADGDPLAASDSQSAQQFPVLEETCPCCLGSTPYYRKCSHCNDLGTVPTEFGRAVIDLVVRHVLNQDGT